MFPDKALTLKLRQKESTSDELKTNLAKQINSCIGLKKFQRDISVGLEADLLSPAVRRTQYSEFMSHVWVSTGLLEIPNIH